MSVTSGNHMCWRSCKGSQDSVFNKTMLRITRQGSHKTVSALPSPARSLDLSPIEHIWDNFGRRVGHPMGLNELEARLQQI
ncbi:uncharacterized protein TNCV_2760931 [Trichonephila clavipes]|nr:uncharacterized protein TNCV_2760931 [Trichonephila clavipes]